MKGQTAAQAARAKAKEQELQAISTAKESATPPIKKDSFAGEQVDMI